MSGSVSLRLYRWQQVRQGLLAGGIVAVLLLLLWWSNLFAQVRLRLSNVYFVPAAVSDKIVIVAIDDASLSAYGRSLTDWPRTIYAELVQNLSAAGARVVVFDLVFDLPAAGDEALVSAIQQARLSEARTRTIMPVIGVQFQGETAVTSQSIRFNKINKMLRPAAVFLDSIDATGFVNVFPDVDGTIRRQPSLVQLEDGFGLSLSIASYLAYLRVPVAAWPQVIQTGDRTLQVTPERTLPVDEFGFWLQNYFGPPSAPEHTTFLTVSLLDVVLGKVDATVFADKVILVGLMNTTAFIDQYPVPTSIGGRMMAGVEIQANAIETLIQNQFVREQSGLSQVGMIIILTMSASLIYAQLRWYWMALTAVLLCTGWIVFCFVVYSFRLEIINLFHSTLALVVPVVVNGAISISVEVNRRKKTEFLLASLAGVSSHQLVLERILPAIVADVHRLVRTPAGGIWLWNDENQKLELNYEWSAPAHSVRELEGVCNTVHAKQHIVINALHAAVPVIWQNRTVAVIAMRLTPGQTISSKQAGLLQEFAHQIAPALENAILYNQVERQRTLLETILAGSPTAILVLDSDLRLRRANSALNDTLQFDLSSLTGHPFADVLKAVHLPEEIQEMLEGNFKACMNFRQELPVNTKTLEIEAAPLQEFQQWVVILNDVTNLADLNKLKTHMIRMASHDLKNPLTRVLLYADLALNVSGLPEKSRHAIQHITRGAQEMKRIITDILDLEQLRSEAVQRAPVDMREVIDEVIEQHQVNMTTKRQIFTADIRPELLPVFGNRRHLIQMSTNLLGNAVKYTPDEGRITLRLYQIDTQLLRLEIEDTGYGIPVEDQKKLFTEFYRVRTRATAHITGTGLGLSLAKTVADAHGGRIWVQSEEAHGSTFFVELPTLQEAQHDEIESTALSDT